MRAAWRPTGGDRRKVGREGIAEVPLCSLQAAAAAQGLREGDPAAVIVGPAAAVPSAERLATLLGLVSAGSLPLSAISVHAYGRGALQRNVAVVSQALRDASLELPIHLHPAGLQAGRQASASASPAQRPLVHSTRHRTAELPNAPPPRAVWRFNSALFLCRVP